MIGWMLVFAGLLQEDSYSSPLILEYTTSLSLTWAKDCVTLRWEPAGIPGPVHMGSATMGGQCQPMWALVVTGRYGDN